MQNPSQALLVTGGCPVVDRDRHLSAVLEVLTTAAVAFEARPALHDLCVEVTGALDLLGCAALLHDAAGGTLRVAGASGPPAGELAEFQVSTGSGPAVEVAGTGEAVVEVDLPDRPDPFSRRAAAAGGTAAVTLALVGGGAVHGSIQFLAGTAPCEHLLAAAALTATAVGVAVGNAEVYRTSSALAVQLAHALESRMPIEQAKGLLAERHGVDVDEAFRILRGHSRRTRTSMTRTARAVLDGSALVVPAPARTTRPSGPTELIGRRRCAPTAEEMAST